MKITLDEYINNPMGTGSSVMANKAMYSQMYKAKFDALLLKEAGSFKLAFAREKDKRFYIHFYIPSEDVPNFTYDVVFEFIPKDLSIESEPTLKNYNVKFYSNDPSFTFTHAHAFYKNDILINNLKFKCSKKSLDLPAEYRNPNNDIGYVKSIYMAYLYYKLNHLDNKTNWKELRTVSTSQLFNSVKHATSKYEEAQEKKKEARLMRKQENSERGIGSNTTKSVSRVKRTSTVKNSGRVRRVKTVKRI